MGPLADPMAASWNNCHGSGLGEMAIKGQHLFDVKVFNDDFAGAISEAPVAVRIVTKHGPSLTYLHLADEVYGDTRQVHQVSAQGNCAGSFTTGPQ